MGIVRHSVHALIATALILLNFNGDGTLEAEEELVLSGLDQPMEILRDRWGIGHIYARTEHDLFFAQGFNAAQDRLFQLELWRRQATGTLAEIQGPEALKRDVGARLLAYRGDMDQELAHYHPRGAEIVSAFVEGINAYVELTEREPERLPLPFLALGITPGHWTPEVVVSRHNGLFRNVGQEVRNTRLVSLLGADTAREILHLQPGRPELKLDESINPNEIPPEVLELYTASRASIRFRPEDVLPEYRRLAPPEPSELDSAFLPDGGDDPGRFGSNNWAISRDRTLSRHPIVANDPHRAMQIPSLRYWVHLVGPGWDVIGGGEPALPGVSIGHNRRGAWGLTIFPIDQEDLYVYETHPEDPSLYRYRDAWEAFRIVPETFAVKGQDDVNIDLKFTRHGPLIFEDQDNQKAYALRAAWLEVGSAPYLASLRIDQAGTWEEFQSACRFARTPSLNMVWADEDGRIGRQTVGISPLRRGWEGNLPVPGDGRFEWDGFLPPEELPRVVDPQGGWVGSANENNLPMDYPHAVGFSWADPFRYARVAEVLDSGRRHALLDMMQLQQDELSIPARLLVPMLRGLELEIPAIREARNRLLDWDFVLDVDSVPAAIYVSWERRLKEAVVERFLPEEVLEDFPAASLSTELLIRWLTTPDGRFGDDPGAGRDALLLAALERAVLGLHQRLGPDQDHWRYGQAEVKHIRLRHPLSAALNDETRDRLDLGPLPRGGSGTTVNSTSDALNQATGASFRIISVVDDWDRSVGTSTPGQSEDPASAHYADLFAPWATGQYFPVLSSRTAVESVTETTTRLIPEAIDDRP
ncbi:penicillin acylase family protein [soil metagenome]